MARVAVMTYIVIYITQVRMIGGISAYFFINAAAVLMFQPLLGKVTDRFGVHISLGASRAFFAAVPLLLADCAQTWQRWLVGVFNALGFEAGLAQLQALALRIAAPNRCGVGQHTVYIGNGAGDLPGLV